MLHACLQRGPASTETDSVDHERRLYVEDVGHSHWGDHHDGRGTHGLGVWQRLPSLVSCDAVTQWRSDAVTRASDSWPREPGLLTSVLPCQNVVRFFILHFSSSRSYRNEYLAIDSGGDVSMTCLHPLIAVWLDAGCWKFKWCLIEQVCQGVKCKALWTILRI